MGLQSLIRWFCAIPKNPVNISLLLLESFILRFVYRIFRTISWELKLRFPILLLHSVKLVLDILTRHVLLSLLTSITVFMLRQILLEQSFLLLLIMVRLLQELILSFRDVRWLMNTDGMSPRHERSGHSVLRELV